MISGEPTHRVCDGGGAGWEEKMEGRFGEGWEGK